MIMISLFFKFLALSRTPIQFDFIGVISPELKPRYDTREPSRATPKLNNKNIHLKPIKQGNKGRGVR